MSTGIKKLYLISGLGADHRAFVNLKIPGVSTQVIEWISPDPEESIQAYVARLRPQIDTEQEVCLLGVSFGGIIAQELSKVIPCQQVIIVSSVQSHEEYSPLLRIARRIRMDKIIPGRFLKFLGKLLGPFFFSVETANEKKLLKAIMQDTEIPFLKWAIDQIMIWRGTHVSGTLHIHGTSDRIFPGKYLRNFHPIDQGGHFMIYNKAEEVVKLIQSIC